MLFVLLALVPSSVVCGFMACGLVPINCLQLASIAYKELFPVVIAAHLWGSLWSKQYMFFRSDNLAFVTIQLYRTSQVPALMHLLCDLPQCFTPWNFTFSAADAVPGVN